MRLLAAGLPFLLTLAAAGCAVTSGEAEDDALATEDALTSYAVADLAPAAPPEHRVTTRRAPALLGPALEAGRPFATIRTLTFERKRARLVVDDHALVTSVVEDEAFVAATRAAAPTDDVEGTAYARSLAAVASSGGALESLDRDAPVAGAAEPFALTVDMCQSRKPWDRNLFEWAVRLSDQLREPVPVGIAMTGGWAKAHPGELETIVSWEREKKLAITWINHSSTHPLHCLDASCRRAEFLTARSVDFDEEVLGLERALVARGLVPSVLFRFPGLVHDAARLLQLARLSLMPLDADAWIAKGQPIKPFAVVLVHGNGNEPPGITGFLRQATDERRAAALRAGTSALVSPLFVAPSPPR